MRTQVGSKLAIENGIGAPLDESKSPIRDFLIAKIENQNPLETLINIALVPVLIANKHNILFSRRAGSYRLTAHGMGTANLRFLIDTKRGHDESLFAAFTGAG